MNWLRFFLFPAIFYATKNCTKHRGTTRSRRKCTSSNSPRTWRRNSCKFRLTKTGSFNLRGPWGFLVGFLEPPRLPKYPKNHHQYKSCLKAKSFMRPDGKNLTKTKTNRNENVSIDPARPGSQSDYPGSPNEFWQNGDQDLPPKTAWFLGDFSVVSFFFCPYWCQTRQNLASALLMMSNFGSYKRISLQILKLIV